MADFTIEREVVIEAPVEVVWRTITEPDQISQWFADREEPEAKPGARGYLGFGDQGGPIVVEAVDPPTRFSFRWNHPAGEEPVAGNSMLVEFTLEPDGSERTTSEGGRERPRPARLARRRKGLICRRAPRRLGHLYGPPRPVAR